MDARYKSTETSASGLCEVAFHIIGTVELTRHNVDMDGVRMDTAVDWMLKTEESPDTRGSGGAAA